MIDLDPISRSLIVSHARTAAPYEACGLISRRTKACEVCESGLLDPTAESVTGLWVCRECGSSESGAVWLKIWRAENAADEPRYNYLIGPKEQLALLEQIVREDHELVGLWHSHPSGDPEPSDVDRALAHLRGILELNGTPSAAKLAEVRSKGQLHPERHGNLNIWFA